MSDLIYKGTGGLKYGYLNVTWPLAQIEIYQDKIRLRIRIPIIQGFSISKAELETIEPFQGFPGPIGKGIRLVFRENTCIFWSFSRDKLIKILEKAGYAKKIKTNSAS